MASSSDSAPMPEDVSESETHYSSAAETFSAEEAVEHIDQVRRSSSSDSDTVPVCTSESGSTAIQQAEDAAGDNSARKVMEAGHRYVWLSRFHWKGRRKRGGGAYENIKKNLKISSRHYKEQGKNATCLDNSEEVHYFSLRTIKDATNYFCHEAKLGEGGYGPVYKGKLDNGKEIAVKRALINSSQDVEEFKNEGTIIGKLQHKNIVRLLGYCLDKNEQILVYEYMANTSLDAFLFDPTKRMELNWPKRVKIISGIAKGLAYLHEDSRVKVIHRDLKASNVLLDEEMNPKISDFGTARIFGGNQFEARTDSIIGTIGYMAPEYAMHGLFSNKTDVYSFGVMVLEIVSATRNNSPGVESHVYDDLLSFAWKQWRNQTPLEMLQQNLRYFSHSEVIKCIQIGLLCVQENPDDRPTMAKVVSYLSSLLIELPLPREPGFYTDIGMKPNIKTGESTVSSINDLTMSDFFPR